MKKCVIFLLIMLGLFSAACSKAERDVGNNSEAESERLVVYTTLYPLQYFTEQIGGDFVEVTNIVPVGADAHTFEPTAKTMISVANGDVLIYSGAGMEGFVEAMLTSIDQENVDIVNASEGIRLLKWEAEHDDGDEHVEHHHLDPHVWLDPLLSIELAERIKDALIKQMPERSESFTNHFLRLQAELTELHEQFEKMLEDVSKQTFIVSHAAYGYWEERYGLKQIGVTGLSPTNEPSQKKLQEIVELANEHRLNHIAFEQNVTSKVAKTVQKELGAEIVYLHNLESLTDEDVANGEDYFSLMKKNIESLRMALN